MATNSPTLAETARVLRGGGAAEGPHPADPLLPGHGLTLSDLQGALGASQMDKLGDILAERAQVAHRYDELLEPLSWLKRPPGGTCPGHGPYLCLLAPPEAEGSEEAWGGRDRLLAELGRAGICCRQPGRCLPGLSYFQKRYRLRAEDYPHALAAERLAIALPLYVGMSQGEQERVVAELTAAHEIILAECQGERPGEAPGEKPALPRGLRAEFH
jgi:dTDP-4-amino-4,6-dideoxygalactose transaminase